MCQTCVKKGIMTQEDLDSGDTMSGLGKSFMDALLSGDMGGLEALLGQADKDAETQEVAAHDRSLELVVQGARNPGLAGLSERNAAEAYAGTIMYGLEARHVAYVLALFALRQARAKSPTVPAPVSAVDLKDDGAELIDAALTDELNADDAQPRRASWVPGFSKQRPIGGTGLYL